MRLNDLRDGARAFVDSNILIYHFAGKSADCRAFLQRCEQGRVEALTGAHIVLEVTHRLMILEALQKGLIPSGQPARRLKRRPEVVKVLSDYNRAVRQIPQIGIRVHDVQLPVVNASEAVRVKDGLMTNDSVTVAMMQELGLTQIATHDSDLQRVSNLEVYQPGDVPGA